MRAIVGLVLAAASAAACEDSASWKRVNSKGKMMGCSWVAKKTGKRCGKTSTDGVKADVGCMKTCGTCPPCSGPCCDSMSWYFRQKKKNCRWVARQTKRCNKRDGSGVRARNACPMTCDTCPPEPTAQPTTLLAPTHVPTMTEHPTAQPTSAEPTARPTACDPQTACCDSTSWFYQNRPAEGCPWAAGDMWRCNRVQDGVRARDACPVACENPAACPKPTADPTAKPTADPTAKPTADPTAKPTADPTAKPTADPTAEPTADPTADPTAEPTANPTTEVPSAAPTATAAPTPEVSSTCTSLAPLQRTGAVEGAADDDEAGTAVAVSDDTVILAVGAPHAGAAAAGSVRVFEQFGDKWVEIGAFDGAAGDQTGAAVALSGDGMAVAFGAPGHDGGRGRAAVYGFDGVAWAQRGGDVVGDGASDALGASVALSRVGAVLAVGADAGYVRAFNFTGAWTQLGADVPAASVRLSRGGLTMAAGAADALRVYDYEEDAWVQRGGVVDAGAALGRSLALSGEGSVVASGSYDAGGAGRVRIYADHGTAGWVQRGGDLAGVVGSKTGAAVALDADGTTVAVGAPWGASSKGGSVRVFDYVEAGKAWTQRGPAVDGDAWELAGTSLDLDLLGAAVAVGAPAGILGGAGHASVFEVPPCDGQTPAGAPTTAEPTPADATTAPTTQFECELTDPQERGRVEGAADDDAAGTSVSLSSDGLMLAVGAPNHGGGAGRARVFERFGVKLVQIGGDLGGDPGDLAGTSVALSGDGLAIAVGGPGRGRTRVYDYGANATWTQRGGDIVGGGSSVALSRTGAILAVGSKNTSSARVYNFTGSAWIQLGDDIDSVSRVALSDNGMVLAVDVPFPVGALRVYDFEGAAWAQRGADLDASNVIGPVFGGGLGGNIFAGPPPTLDSLALSGDGLVVAAGKSDEVVRVFAFDGAWLPRGPDIAAALPGDETGKALALDEDGSSVAVGAPGAGTKSGQVRVFDFDGATWTPWATLDGAAAWGRAGAAVALDRSGARVAFGAPAGLLGGAGSARVYDLPTSCAAD